jgi:hypothetical protein
MDQNAIRLMIGEKFIFIHIPRTGGTSLERLLLSIDSVKPWEELTSKKLVDHQVGPQKHFKASRVEALVGENKWKRAKKISIVRNPFDKVISHYFQPFYRDINALSGKSLTDFLLAYRPAVHEDGVTCSDYLDRDVDTILRYENYTNEVLQLFSGYHVTEDMVKQRIGAVRDNPEYRGYYSKVTRQLVEKIYQSDFERFGYHF